MNAPGNDPWMDLIALCDVVNNFNPLGPDLTDALLPLLNLDGLLWFLAGDIAFGNSDSYGGNSNNWYLVHDMRHDRMEVVNHDLGLAYGTWDNFGPEFSITHGLYHGKRPLASRAVVPDLELKREYFAHLRTLNEEVLRWDVVGPLAHQYRDLIDAAVQDDPKKLYTYQQFLDNIDQPIDVGFWWADAVRPYVEDRHTFMSGHPKLTWPQVEFDLLRNLPVKPEPTESVAIQARVTAAEPPSGVELRWRVVGHFQRVPMRDDGLSGDGAAGDGIFGALIPPQAPGARVDYYVVGTGATKGAKSFVPNKGEFAPLSYSVRFGGVGLRITEYMYDGSGFEFLELTNTTTAPLDLAGWSLDDASAQPGTFDLSPAGVVAPGQSIAVTETDAATFRAEWNLGPAVVVLGDNTVAKLGRDDAIHVFDDTGQVQDRLAYGDQDFPGTQRAQGASAWGCDGALGADDPYRWQLSVSADDQGSWVSASGDVGSPGSFALAGCPSLGTIYCSSNPNSTGQAAEVVASGSPVVGDNDLTLAASPVPSQQFGFFLMSDAQGHVPGFGGSQGVLCLGSPIVRFAQDLLSSGAGSEMTFSPDLQILPGGTVILPGETWNFQLWYRDANPGSTSNTSSAVEIAFY